MKSYFKPWIGSAFVPGGLLVMSESVYRWDETSSAFGRNHLIDHTVKYFVFTQFGNHGRRGRYIVALTRALCREWLPSPEKVKQVWSKIAYTVYVQECLDDVHKRPTTEQFVTSGEPFLALIEKLRPGRIVITGYQTWVSMPYTQVFRHKYKQAYRLKDGTLVWCLAVPHVQSQKKGHRFKWKDIGRKIQKFVDEALPER